MPEDERRAERIEDCTDGVEISRVARKSRLQTQTLLRTGLDGRWGVGTLRYGYRENRLPEEEDGAG